MDAVPPNFIAIDVLAHPNRRKEGIIKLALLPNKRFAD
jgi:hypothetical protein